MGRLHVTHPPISHTFSTRLGVTMNQPRVTWPDRPAGQRVGLEANGQAVNLGWHMFRHTYRSLLDATGAPIGVQQKRMRHAQVSTTMDVYGNALMESKRAANSKVVGLLLRVPRDAQSLQA
jgi:integrase